MNRKFTLVFVLLILALVATACGKEATPVPTNTPAPPPTPEVTLGEEIRSEEGGYAFRAIPGYEVERFRLRKSRIAKPETSEVYIRQLVQSPGCSSNGGLS